MHPSLGEGWEAAEPAGGDPGLLSCTFSDGTSEAEMLVARTLVETSGG